MIHRIWSQFTSDAGRKGLAFLFTFGGAVTMTLYAIAALYMVRASAGLVFWLGIAAHVQILAGMGVFYAAFVKRRIKAGRDGVEISDEGTGE